MVTEFDNFLRATKELDALGNAVQYSYQISDGGQAGSLGSLGAPTEITYPTFVHQTKIRPARTPHERNLAQYQCGRHRKPYQHQSV